MGSNVYIIAGTSLRKKDYKMWYIKCLGAHASEGPFGVSFISSMDNPPLGRVEKQCKAKTKWYIPSGTRNW